MYYIYSINNTINSKKYIGITIDPDRRLWEHLSRKPGKWGCPILSRAILKYGKENFYMEILFCTGNREEAYDAEVFYIHVLDTYNRGYNASLGGEGSDRLVPWNKGSRGLVKPSSTTFKIGDNVGEKHPRSKVTDAQRLEMYNRYKSGEAPKVIAKDYGIHWSNVYRAVKFIERQSMGQG